MLRAEGSDGFKLVEQQHAADVSSRITSAPVTLIGWPAMLAISR